MKKYIFVFLILATIAYGAIPPGSIDSGKIQIDLESQIKQLLRIDISENLMAKGEITNEFTGEFSLSETRITIYGEPDEHVLVYVDKDIRLATSDKDFVIVQPYFDAKENSVEETKTRLRNNIVLSEEGVGETILYLKGNLVKAIPAGRYYAVIPINAVYN